MLKTIPQPMGSPYGEMMKREYILYPTVLLAIIFIGLFIYPTLYKYDKFDQRYPVKINRVTGKTEMLTATGWIEMVGKETAPSTSSPAHTEPERDQEGLTFQEYFSKLKENTKHPENLSEKTEYFEWRRKVLGIVDYNFIPKDDGERFSIGDTQEKVKMVMGTPDEVTLGGNRWFYGQSYIHFVGPAEHDLKVSEYGNVDHNLKVK